MHLQSRWALRGILVWLLLCITLSSGCVKMASHLIYVFKGNDIPAEFNELKGKSVALVCASDSGIGSDANSILLARYLQGMFSEKIKDIKLISQEEIGKWTDGQEKRSNDYLEIGRGAKADYVVVVEILNLTLRDGSTLFRGKSDLTVSVFDTAKTSRPVFRKQIPEFTYPVVAGVPTTESDETKFRRMYLMQVAQRVGRHFYPYEPGSDVAIDAKILAYD